MAAFKIKKCTVQKQIARYKNFYKNRSRVLVVFSTDIFYSFVVTNTTSYRITKLLLRKFYFTFKCTVAVSRCFQNSFEK